MIPLDPVPASDPIPSDMQAALGKFQRQAVEIVNSFKESIPSQPPAIIYHYTNDVGLKGILKTGKIWLSDVFSLNDPSELSHGFSILLSVLKQRAETESQKEFVKGMHYFRTRIRDSAQYFSCSLSGAGDDLGQWRAYADNGRGYALGFDATALETSFGAGTCNGIPNCATFPITYDDDKLKAIYQTLVDKMFGLISLPGGRNLSEAVLRSYWNNLSVLLAMHAMDASLFFKHKAYLNEQEYRFLAVYEAGRVLADMQLRMRPYTLVKYLEFDWKGIKPGVLKRIVVGPAADFSKARRFAGDCLGMFHVGAVPIDQSNIPYRAT